MIKNTNALQKVVTFIGFFLIAISLYCSFLLYTSFSDNLSDKAAWGGMGLGLDAFKNIALVAALALWTLGFLVARLLSVIVFIAYAILTLLSFMAFFGFMSTVQHQLEQEAVLASSEYQRLTAALTQADQHIAALSVYADPEQKRAAAAELAKLTPLLMAAKTEVTTWTEADGTVKTNSRGQPYTTKAREAQEALAAIEAKAEPWQTVIDKYQAYQAALAHQAHLLAQKAALNPSNVEVNHSSVHPMFVDLGKLMTRAPEEMKVAFMFISSASAEILGTLSILIAVLLGRQRSFTIEEIELLSVQLRDQHSRLQQAFAYNPPPLPALNLTPAETVPTDPAASPAEKKNSVMPA